LVACAAGPDVCGEPGDEFVVRPAGGGGGPTAALPRGAASGVRGRRGGVQLVDPRGYFREFEPVADLLHVLCHVYSSACAVGPDEPGGWRQYRVRMRACRQGRVAEVLVELDDRQMRSGLPPDGEARSAEDRRDPRRVVWEARSYLRDNRGRMGYPRYRREGLPTTSSPVESSVGEFNARVRGKQKHRTRTHGAEPILQLRAAVLSGDGRPSRYFADRPGSPFRKRHPVEKTGTPAAQTAA
jgi:hypothetical protein